ncbi:MAG: toll/interleukin-1 receptor domain-containing protein, partial [Ktedonobacteraceae bacterium]|nr:toll/interleukin-1 receptor domain-containing protein [Ktedonobacteraceae bacterium]
DKRYLHELTTHLAPYVQSEVVDVWDDTQIPPGSKWREEIEKALQSAKVAILLVSAEFLASDFIMNFELPSLLAASEQEGIIFLSVLLRPCAFTNIDIGQFQSVNMPSTPLSKMKRAKRDEVWSKVAEFVKEALSKAE